MLTKMSKEKMKLTFYEVEPFQATCYPHPIPNTCRQEHARLSDYKTMIIIAYDKYH